MFYILKVHVSESMTPQKLSLNQLWYSHNITRYSDDFVYTLFRAIYHEKGCYRYKICHIGRWLRKYCILIRNYVRRQTMLENKCKQYYL